MRSKHREMLEDKLTALQESEDDNKRMDVSKSDDSDSEAASKDDISSDDDGVAVVAPTSVEKKVSITLTSSSVPSNTFITDQFKSTDPSVVRLIHNYKITGSMSAIPKHKPLSTPRGR